MQNKNLKPLLQISNESALQVLWLGVMIFTIYLLQGCGNKRVASVEERHTKPSNVRVNTNDDYSAVDAKTKSYTVRAGDTLYSIAFRFGLDYQSLARANGIGSSYRINVGQKLNIDAARNYQASSQRQTAQVTRAENRPSSTKRSVDTSKKSRQTTQTATSSKPKSKPKQSSSTPKSDTNNPVKFWIWPNMGRVNKSFVATGRKGIDISGNIGDPVRASAAGRVVYAGRGLRGYGNLIIIKHNNNFISAYAHNKQILVKESEIIKAGQKIGEIGNSDTDLPKLHFEIRYKGKPVDPLKYLPKR